MSVFLAWLRATRLIQMILSLVPVMVGQLTAVEVCGAFDPVLFWGTLTVVALAHTAIVMADAWDDHRVRRFAPFGGDGKAIDHMIKRPGVPLAIAISAAGAGIVLALLLWVLWGSWPVLPMTAVALLLYWLHSLPPVRISHFAGSELFQTAYVGVYLPVVGFAGQAAGYAGMPAGLLALTASLGLSVVLALTVLDVETDRTTDRRTLAAVLGPAAGRIAAAVVAGGAVAVYLFTNPMQVTLEARLLPAALPVLFWAFSAMIAGPHRSTHRSAMFAALVGATTLATLAAFTVAISL